MDFFSGLKEDLSQAVNDLKPEDVLEPVSEQEKQADAPQQSEEEIDVDLEKMLENIETYHWQELEAEQPPVKVMEPAGMMAPVLGPEEVSDLAEVIASTFAEEAFEEEAVAEDVLANRTAEYKPSRPNMEDGHSVVAAGMLVAGDITVDGNLTVVGNVNGNVTVSGMLHVYGRIAGNCKAAEMVVDGARIQGEIVCEGTIEVGAASVILGNVKATGAVITGAIKGDIDVTGTVVLESSAIVVGNVKSKTVQIENGAVIEGMCSQCYADVSPIAFFDEFKNDTKTEK